MLEREVGMERELKGKYWRGEMGGRDCELSA